MDPVQQVRDHGRRIIETELIRLARKNPRLSAHDLAVIDRSLDGLLDRLLVGRLRALTVRRPELVPAAVTLVLPSPPRLLQ